jgi:hypothetical protein
MVRNKSQIHQEMSMLFIQSGSIAVGSEERLTIFIPSIRTGCPPPKHKAE